MKDEMLELVAELRDDNINLIETPVKFTWNYKEEPKVTFDLTISEVPDNHDKH